MLNPNGSKSAVVIYGTLNSSALPLAGVIDSLHVFTHSIGKCNEGH
jgi:hypothetical protein